MSEGALAQGALASPSRMSVTGGALVRSVGPVVLAILVTGAIVLALGRDPIEFYGDVLDRGLLRTSGLQESAIRMAPLLLLAAGLIVAFRANVWNLGVDGQFLLGAVVVAALGPPLVEGVPRALALAILFVVGGAVGAAWTLVPSLLRAYSGVNEIVTSLMMTFLGVSLANLLVKEPFDDPDKTVPQTEVLPVDDRLPSLPGMRVHIGVLVALAAVLLVHWTLTRTSIGLRLQVLGANPRAASHFGLNVPRLIVVAFLVSGGLAGMAGANEILGVWGVVRADWNPAWGLTVIPLVFLARFNGFAVIGFVAFFAVLQIGGEYATRQARLPSDFILVIVGLILIFMALTEFLSVRAQRGSSYLGPGLRGALGRRRREA